MDPEQFESALLLLGLLCGSLLLHIGVIQLWVMSPLGRLSDAASRVSQGGFTRARGMLKQFLVRNNEFSVIGRGLDMAVQRLQTPPTTSNRLLDDIDSTIATIERVSLSMTGASTTQEERSKEVLGAVAPIGRFIDRLTRQMVEVRNAVVQISLAWSNADQSQSQVLIRGPPCRHHAPQSRDRRGAQLSHRHHGAAASADHPDPDRGARGLKPHPRSGHHPARYGRWRDGQCWL